MLEDLARGFTGGLTSLFPDHRPTWQDESHELLRGHAREFFAKEVTPNQTAWARQGHVDRGLWNSAGAAGLLLTDIPDELGGGDGDFGHEAVVAQELAYAHDSSFGFTVHSTIVSHSINAYGTEEQRQRWLPGLASGEKMVAVAMTEPGTGSDLQNDKTAAIRDGDHYVVNGAKTFISNGTHCDLVIIVARTTRQPTARASRKADVYAGKAMLDDGIRRQIEGTLDAAGASRIKMWATDMQGRVVDKCLQLFGGYGDMMEHRIARMYAASRVQRLYGGTNEIMKLRAGL